MLQITPQKISENIAVSLLSVLSLLFPPQTEDPCVLCVLPQQQLMTGSDPEELSPRCCRDELTQRHPWGTVHLKVKVYTIYCRF